MQGKIRSSQLRTVTAVLTVSDAAIGYELERRTILVLGKYNNGPQ